MSSVFATVSLEPYDLQAHSLSVSSVFATVSLEPCDLQARSLSVSSVFATVSLQSSVRTANHYTGTHRGTDFIFQHMLAVCVSVCLQQ